MCHDEKTYSGGSGRIPLAVCINDQAVTLAALAVVTLVAFATKNVICARRLDHGCFR